MHASRVLQGAQFNDFPGHFESRATLVGRLVKDVARDRCLMAP